MADRRSLQWLADEFNSCFVQVLDSMTELQHSAETRLAPVETGEYRWSEYPVSGKISGGFAIGASRATATRLGGSVLTAAGVEADNDSALSTFAELVAQAFSALGQSVSTRIGGPVSVDAPLGRPGPPANVGIELKIGPPDGEESILVLVPTDPLLAGLGEYDPQRSGESQPEANPAPSAPPESKAGIPPTLGLLLDVELPVSVSFGRAHLQIKEVMKLSSGSIVELNRSVAEPVELIVNNCVIARGEVVVIEGNYGVRIDEIVSPEERLRTLS